MDGSGAEGETTSSTTPSRSAMHDTLVRFGGDLAFAGFGLLTGIVTARALGPPGKGALSTLSYLVALAWPVASLGTGEAGAALTARGRATLERAIQNAVGLLLVTTGVLALAVLAISGIGVLGVADIEKGRLAAAAAVLPTTFVGVLPVLAELRRAFGLTALARVASAAVTFVVTVVLVTGRSQAVFGAMVGVAAGPVAACVVLALGLRRRGLSLRPSWDAAYLRTVVPLGLPIMAGLVLVVGAARADVLLVAWLMDPADVGIYSVAVTISQMATMPAVAVSVAAFPRLATASSEQLPALLRRAVAAAAALGVATALAGAALSPWLLPAVFGEGFRASVEPTVLLLPASVANGVQWTLARAAAARGQSRAFARTFGASFLVMVAADLVLVPLWGLAGAAIGTTLGTLVGLTVACRDLWGILGPDRDARRPR